MLKKRSFLEWDDVVIQERKPKCIEYCYLSSDSSDSEVVIVKEEEVGVKSNSFKRFRTADYGSDNDVEIVTNKKVRK